MSSRAIVVLALAACSAPKPVVRREPAAAAASLPEELVPDCFFGADRCVVRLDLDGDGRGDTIATVRDRACEAEEDEEEEEMDELERARPCQQGFWFSLAAGKTRLVGAGTELLADPDASDEDEPIELDADLDHLHLLAIARRKPDGGRYATQLRASPCEGDALVISGSDAAALLCWRAGDARAYHLGF